jgi:hypothetical protein
MKFDLKTICLTYFNFYSRIFWFSFRLSLIFDRVSTCMSQSHRHRQFFQHRGRLKAHRNVWYVNKKIKADDI